MTFSITPLSTRKPCCRKETARCRSCSFSVYSSPTTFITSLRVAKLPSFESQASQLQTYRHRTEFKAKCRFKVIQSHVFWSQWKGDKAVSNTIHRESKKRETPYSSSYLQQIFTDFKNSFTATICRKFAIKLPLKIPPHLKRVATLPCEILMSENSVT